MKGRCMCGAVSFEATPPELSFHVCHCDMCRRWSGSAFMAITVDRDGLKFRGAENICKIQSSDWAERAWCGKCGTPLYYHVTIEGPHANLFEMSLGTFDDPGKLPFARELFVDQKSPNVALHGAETSLTRSEVLAMFANPEEGTNQ